MKPVLVGLLVAAAAACARPTADSPATIAFTHVTVVNPEDPPMPDATVVVRDGLIAAVGPTATTRVPAGTPVIDGTGKYLVPGLWDMHVHLYLVGMTDLAMLPLYGVTSVRDMGGDIGPIRMRLDSAIAAGLPVPTTHFAGPILESAAWLARIRQMDGDSAFRGSTRIGVTDSAEVRAAVDSAVAGGAEYLKIRTVASAAVFRATAAEAQRRGLRFTAHNPYHGLSLQAIAASGLATLEHVEGGFAGPLDALSPAARDSAVAAVAASGMWFDPNLVGDLAKMMDDSAAVARVTDSTGRIDSTLRLISPTLRRRFQQALGERQYGPTGAEWRARLPADYRVLATLHRAGTRFLAGTDLGGLLAIPGAGLLNELPLLVSRVGLSPREALAAATIEPARFFRAESRTGSIKATMAADLVLLDADPLADIENVKRIAGVVVRGKYWDAAARADGFARLGK